MTTPADVNAQDVPATPTDSFLAYGQWAVDPVVAPYLRQVEQHATGRGYPLNEIEFQELLNQDALNPSYSLKGITGLTAQAASIIIWSEIETNFYNALAHVREAQELFSDNATFSGSDVDVIRRMRMTSIDGQSKTEDQKRTFFAAKKKKDETDKDKKGKKVEVEFKGEILSSEAATVPATPREEKEKEKKEKKERKKAEKEEKKKEKKEKKEKGKKEKKENSSNENEAKSEKKPSLFTKLLRRGGSGKDLRGGGGDSNEGMPERSPTSDDVMGSEPSTSGRGDNSARGDISARETASAREIDSARELNSAREEEETTRVFIEGQSARSDVSNP